MQTTKIAKWYFFKSAQNNTITYLPTIGCWKDTEGKYQGKMYFFGWFNLIIVGYYTAKWKGVK